MAFVLNKKLETRADLHAAGLYEADLELIDSERGEGTYKWALQAIAGYKITPTKAAISAPAVKLLKEKKVEVGTGTVANAKETICALLDEHPSLRDEDPGRIFLKLIYWFNEDKFKPAEE